MIKRPSFFFSQGDCGCNGVGMQLQTAMAVCPPTGARVTDDRYLTLVGSSHGKALVVPNGSNSQTFLTSDFAGFAFYRDGEITVVKDPQLTMTLLNPAVSGSYPIPSGFKYLAGATGDPAEWRHIAAPTAGRWIMQSVNGQWVLTDAGSLPGLQDIGNNGTTAVQGGVMLLVNSGTDDDPVWVIRRLAVVDKRVIVGQIDEDTGAGSYRALPGGTFLEHPKARFTTLQSRTYATLDADGDPITDGIEQAVVTGAGAITDPTRVVYSPTTLRFYKEPVRTVATTNVPTNGTSTVPPTSYALMPSGHGAGQNLQYNYAKVMVAFTATMSSGATSDVIQFGVFRDGVLLQEFENDDQRKVTIIYVDLACPYGPHTYDIRWKKSSGSTAVIISNSYLTVQTIG